MKLGDNLRELIEQNDMTQKQLAQELDITPAALGNYIHNTREPDFNTLIRLADFFHVSIDFLLGHYVDSHVTHEEEILLHIYRTLSIDQKELYLEQGKLFIKHNNKKLSLNSNIDDKEICDVS